MENNKILCDRQNFIDCVKGDLLIREGVRITHLGDAANGAVEELKKGKTIYLTRKGKIVSKMNTIKGKFIEERYYD